MDDPGQALGEVSKKFVEVAITEIASATSSRAWYRSASVSQGDVGNVSMGGQYGVTNSHGSRGGRGDGLVGPPCSRNPHDETVVVRRAQLETKPGHPLKEDNAGSQRTGGKEPDHPSCSQNAHDKTVLVRCAQGRTVWLLP